MVPTKYLKKKESVYSLLLDPPTTRITTEWNNKGSSMSEHTIRMTVSLSIPTSWVYTRI